MKKYFYYIALLFVVASCSKEYSVENVTPPVNIAAGTLLDTNGNCREILVSGNYKENVAIDYTNFIKAKINFTAIGSFTIYSDTVNGYWFVANGYAYTTGQKSITINGYGKPILPIDANFKLHFNNSTCFFTVPNDAAVIVAPNINTDYFPTTTNSNWNYFNSFTNDTSLVQVLPIDITVVGNTYRQFKLIASGQSDTLIYRKDGAGNYYKYDVIGSGPQTEFIFLKDYKSVGDTWDSPTVTGVISGSPASVKYHYTLTAKNITATIGTNIFDSIINVQEETQYLVSGTFTTQSTFIYSYAKKVGLVDVEQQNAIPNISVPLRKWNIY
jgi:hypothetical protein